MGRWWPPVRRQIRKNDRQKERKREREKERKPDKKKRTIGEHPGLEPGVKRRVVGADPAAVRCGKVAPGPANIHTNKQRNERRWFRR